MNINEFKKYLVIDKGNLDEELIRQPSLFYEVSEAYTIACADRDTCKEALALVDAKLDGAVRSAHEQVKSKPTEAMIKADIQCDDAHAKAFAKYTTAKEKADKLGVLKDAFHQRSYMLRELCSLHISNYFGETSVKGTSVDQTVYDQRRVKLSEARKNTVT